MPKVGNQDPEEGADESAGGHLALPPHVLGYGSAGRGRYSAQQQQSGGARTYALQPISSSVPNPSASGPRMHDYAIRQGGPGAQAVQVPPGLLSVRTPMMATSHAVIGGSSVAASASAPASVPLSVSRSVSGALSSRRSDGKSATSTTSSSEDVDIDFDIDINVDGNEDVDSHRGGLHRLRRRQEHDIEVDVEGMEGVRGVVRWEANNMYGASAVGHAYGHALCSSYSSTGSVDQVRGMGLGRTARRGGVVMKREDECVV